MANVVNNAQCTVHSDQYQLGRCNPKTGNFSLILTITSAITITCRSFPSLKLKKVTVRQRSEKEIMR